MLGQGAKILAFLIQAALKMSTHMSSLREMGQQLLSSDLRFAARVVVGLILVGLSLTAKAQSSTPPSSSTAGEGSTQGSGSLIVIAGEARYKTIRFGDQLDIVVTLQNQGSEPISIEPGALILKNEGWTGFPGLGSGLGECPLTRLDESATGPITIQAGEVVILAGSNREMAAESIGPMTARFAVQTQDKSVIGEADGSKSFEVSYHVTPSEFLLSAWAARTQAEQQQLQPEMTELLRLAARNSGWRDQNYVVHTLNYAGCSCLPILKLTLKDPDPVVRRQAVSALSRATWAAHELNGFIAEMIEKNEERDWASMVSKCDSVSALKESIPLTFDMLGDDSPDVRIAALSVLTDRAVEENFLRSALEASKRNHQVIDEQNKREYDTIGLIETALPMVQKMASSDADATVRAAA